MRFYAQVEIFTDTVAQKKDYLWLQKNLWSIMAAALRTTETIHSMFHIKKGTLGNTK